MRKKGKRGAQRSDSQTDSGHIERKPFVVKRYPPGDLPKATQDELRNVVNKSEKEPADVDLLSMERDRAQRKIGFFNNLKDDAEREEAEARKASATATHYIAVTDLDKLAKDGAAVQGGRHRGGKKTAEHLRGRHLKTRQRVYSEYDKLVADGTPRREIAKKIADTTGKSASQVRRILKTRSR